MKKIIVSVEFSVEYSVDETWEDNELIDLSKELVSQYFPDNYSSEGLEDWTIINKQAQIIKK